MAGWLDSKLLTLLESGLDGLSLRNKVLADNIANNDTPNFKRSDVKFDQVLQEAMDGSKSGHLELIRESPRHLSGVVSSSDFIFKDNSTTIRNDGNNVDIDQEMVKLAENTLQYNAIATAMTAQIALLKQAIQG